MTASEQKSVDRLVAIALDIREENSKFRHQVSAQVETLTSKVDKKHTPVYLEQDILNAAQQAIAASIQAVLTGYNSPLSKLVTDVVNTNSAELKTIIADAFTNVIRTDDFKQSIVAAFSHKVARTIISNNDGLFDKVANELKQDTIFKSKMALAVANVVEECLIKKV